VQRPCWSLYYCETVTFCVCVVCAFLLFISCNTSTLSLSLASSYSKPFLSRVSSPSKRRRFDRQLAKMKLTVKTLKGSHFEIRVQPSDTVSFLASPSPIFEIMSALQFTCNLFGYLESFVFRKKIKLKR
jgi:hypothetical protein